MVADASPKRLASSSTVPTPTSRPAAKIPTRSHTGWTWWSRWLDSRTATPSLVGERADEVKDLDHAHRVDGGGRLVEDEDRRASLTSASAMPRRWRMPREYLSTRSSARRPGPPGRAPRRSAARPPGRDPVEARRVAQVLAAGHAAVEADGFGQVADLALDLAAGCAPDPARATRALPVVGSVSPRSIRMVVVLPAPFGPSSPKISPGRTSRSSWSTAVRCRTLGQPARPDEGLGLAPSRLIAGRSAGRSSTGRRRRGDQTHTDDAP